MICNMTNWDKFREVFGISEDNKIAPIGSVCDFIDYHRGECLECSIYKTEANDQCFWDREYKKKG